MTRKEQAMKNFTDGYNCAQAVALAFADVLSVDQKTLSTISSSFGGGMGRLREVCGGFSGSLMVLSLLCGYDTPETGEAKKELYSKVQELAARYANVNGSIVCRDLLNLSKQKDDPTPEARTKEYYTKRPCTEIVGNAAEVLEQYLKELGVLR